MYRLDARSLVYDAGSTRILRNINLSLKGGELVALLGPSGSGKSTLLNALTGFRPGKGRVHLCGHDLYEEIDTLKTLIGFVPQDDIIHKTLSVEKTIDYSARLRLPHLCRAERKETVAAVLDAVELTERRGVRVKSLSGGQRKRVSVAVELLAQPPLLFLDEPTSGLDPALEEKTMQLFRSLTGQGRLTVVTTHVLASLDIVDLVLILSKGHLVYVGTPGQAPEFFGVADIPSIYRVLGQTSPREWATKLEGSAQYRSLVLDRLATPAPTLPVAVLPGTVPPLASNASPERTKAQPKLQSPAKGGPAPADKAPAALTSAEQELARLKAAKRRS